MTKKNLPHQSKKDKKVFTYTRKTRTIHQYNSINFHSPTIIYWGTQTFTYQLSNPFKLQNANCGTHPQLGRFWIVMYDISTGNCSSHKWVSLIFLSLTHLGASRVRSKTTHSSCSQTASSLWSITRWVTQKSRGFLSTWFLIKDLFSYGFWTRRWTRPYKSCRPGGMNW